MKLRKYFIGLLVAVFITATTFQVLYRDKDCEVLAADNTAEAVTNYSPGVVTELWVIPIVGYATMTSAAEDNILASIVVPSKYTILSIKCRAEGFDNGTASNRFYVDLEEALTGTTTDTTVLTANIAIGTAASSVAGSITDTVLADESLLNIYGWGSGTARATLQIYVQRSN